MADDGRAEIGGSGFARPRWGLLRQQDFRTLWIGEAASGLGNSITVVALPLIAVVVLNVNATAVGLLAAAVWMPWLVVGLPLGAWVDRTRRRPLMIACDLAAATAIISVPVAAWLDVLTFTQLIIVALISGTTAVCFNTAYHAYIPTVVAAGDLLEGNAKLQGSETATRVAGPGVAGLLAQTVGATTGLIADAVTFLVSAFCLSRIRVGEAVPRIDPDRLPLRRQIVAGLSFVRHDRYLRALVIYGASANLALMGYQAVQVVFLVRTVGLDVATIGLLLTSGSVGGIAGAIVASRIIRLLGSSRALILMQLLAGPPALLMAMTFAGPGILLYVLGAFLVGLGITVANIVASSFRQAYCPPHLLGRVVATAMAINHSTIPLGSLLGGLLGDTIGYRPAMFIMTGLLAPCWLILQLSPIGQVRDLPMSYQPIPARTETGR